jgi:hypothetical protein
MRLRLQKRSASQCLMGILSPGIVICAGLITANLDVRQNPAFSILFTAEEAAGLQCAMAWDGA